MIIQKIQKGTVYNIEVDQEDFERIKDMYFYVAKEKTGNHRVLLKLNNRKVKLHRFIMNVLDRSELIDHIDGNTLNNKKSNLRLCIQKQNLRNRSRNINNTSGYKGVSWHKQHKKWRAVIKVDCKYIHLGMFDCKHEAAKKYNQAALEYHKNFALLNEIKL